MADDIVERLVFGVVAKMDPEDLSDIIVDSLEEFSDDEWDWIVWARGPRTFAILHAPLMARSALIRALGKTSLYPQGIMWDHMQDNRNDWVVPVQRRSDTRPALEIAQEMLFEWQNNAWRHEKGTPEALKGDDETDSEEPLVVDLFARKRAAQAALDSRSTNPTQEVLQAFGLLHAKDSQGQNFTFRGPGTSSDPEEDE